MRFHIWIWISISGYEVPRKKCFDLRTDSHSAYMASSQRSPTSIHGRKQYVFLRFQVMFLLRIRRKSMWGIWIWNRKSGYGNPDLDMNFRIWIWNLISGYGNPNLDMDPISGYGAPYPDMRFHIQIWNPISIFAIPYPDSEVRIQI